MNRLGPKWRWKQLRLFSIQPWPYRCAEPPHPNESGRRRAREEQWRVRQSIRPKVGPMIRVPVYSGMNRAERREYDKDMRAKRARRG